MSQATIYTIVGCPYCQRAKNILNNQNISFEEHVYEFDTPEMDELIARTKLETVPQIFIGETFIGGSDDLAELVESGRLAEYL